MLNLSVKALTYRDVFEVIVGQVSCGVELVVPGAVVAFDVSVEFGGSRGSSKRSMPRSWHSRSKSALNSEPPSTWMACMGKGMSAWSLSRKRLALCAVALRQACVQVHLVTGSQAVNCLMGGHPL